MFEVAELGRKLSKQDYAREEPVLREALLEAQAGVREAGFSVIVVIAGVEGSGKGETVNTLLEWLDARGVAVEAMGAPSPEEGERPEYFRFWRRLPPRGEIAIFFGSWYTSPIVERSLEHDGLERFERRLTRIVDFERMLVDEGTLLLKFWLHITKKQQRKRFEKLASDSDTAWRVTERDWEFHETYDHFIEASARAIRRTSTGHAPWEIVEANEKRYRQLTVGRELLQAIEKRLGAAPPPEPEPEPLPTPEKVTILSALDLGQRLDRDEYERELGTLQGRLGRLARRLGEHARSVVLVFEGPDAAGKGGCIRRIVHALDARFYRVHPIAAPTDEEQARPYLWRFWRQLPRRGEFAIFDRSWYGRVLVERIEGFASPQAWRRAYAEINDFEDQLVEGGVLVCKFWLAISPGEQMRRFQAREETGYKRYKLTSEDWRNREKWPAYQAAAAEMIEKTDAVHAPWTLVAAEDKLHARIRVLRTLTGELERVLGPDESPSKRKRKRRKR